MSKKLPNANRIEFLWKKYERNELTVNEFNEFCESLAKKENEAFIRKMLEVDLLTTEGDVDSEKLDLILKRITDSQKKTRIIPFWKYAAAAVLVIILSIAAYFSFIQGDEFDEGFRQIATTNDIPPGHSGAILIVEDGKEIKLDSGGNRRLTEVTHQTGDLLTVQANDKEPVYHTLQTPAGRQFSLLLPDGSKVWLNALSSVKFPTGFTGSERKVEITGEVYFEVSHNVRMPFIVTAGPISVEVLGTHFNINSYSDEDVIKTTLLEGAVKVRSQNNFMLLSPGAQAIYSTSDKLDFEIRHDADIVEVMAWKNGKFYFRNASIEQIMRQAARWYEIEVIFEGEISNEKYNGEISRNTNLSQLMKILELSGLKYRIEGRKVFLRS